MLEHESANGTSPIALIAGPAWDNTSEYPSVQSIEFTADFEEVKKLTALLRQTTQTIQPLMAKTLASLALEFGEREGLISTLQEISKVRNQAKVLLSNLMTYVSCELCIDASQSEMQKLFSQLNQIQAKLKTATTPCSLFLNRAPDDLLTAYLQHPNTKAEEFSLRQSRLLSDTLLSEDEETLLTSLGTHGPKAFAELYDQLSSRLVCSVEPPNQESGQPIVQKMGLAQAAGLLRDASEPTRKAAWHAIQSAWKAQESSTSAILNALTGWRLETYERRSKKRAVHFLDQPLHGSRITRQTLDAMFEAVRSQVAVPRQALSALARGIGKDRLDPWDLLAPAPTLTSKAGLRSFKEALEIIRSAFAEVDPGFGDFVTLMEKNNWLEGRVLATKRQGGFCTGFAKSRTPRIYQTYMGTIADVGTLAHELGHAYHSWVMRDLPLAQLNYPMTLAETASIFAETAFADHMLAHGSVSDKFATSWDTAVSAGSFLLNIPSRFDFEYGLFESRKSGTLTADELSELTDASWRNWYGDTLSKTERQFWMTKLHFSFAEISFYNFPYTFGYLFSLGVYALRAQRGKDFMPSYIALLRDTGSMTAEELVRRHLNEDITQPEFWQKSLAIVERQVQAFETMLQQRQQGSTSETSVPSLIAH